MALMAIDHARIICAPQRYAWIDSLDHAGAGWVVTRLLPNVCTPGFVGIAGVAAGLYAARAGVRAARRFLISRALWLLLLEVTVVQLGWHSFDWRPVYALQVIACLGLCMAGLAAVAGLPRGALAGLGLACVLAPQWPALATLLPEAAATVLVQPGYLLRGDAVQVAVTYPALSWFGLILLGYAAAGPLAAVGPDRRRRVLLGVGAAMAVTGLALRLGGLLDPDPWSGHDRGVLFTAFDLLSLTKHPGSPVFLLVYGAPVVVAMGLATSRSGPVVRGLSALGRAPLFFYVVHLFALQLIAFATLQLPWTDAAGGWWMRGARHWPDGFSPRLWPAWAAWVGVMALLGPATAAWARRKAASDRWWMRYL